MKYLLLFGLMLGLWSCEEKKPTFFDGGVFFTQGHHQNLALTIETHFNECGEWGGNEEEIKVYSRRDKSLYLEYKKYYRNCDRISEDDELTLQTHKKIEINDQHKQLILEYIQALVEAKSREEINGERSGKYFSVKNEDESLKIEYIVDDGNLKFDRIYRQFITELGL